MLSPLIPLYVGMITGNCEAAARDVGGAALMLDESRQFMERDDEQMMTVPVSRRWLLSCALGAPAVSALLASSLATAAESSKCVDPEELTPAEAGLRRSLGYTDTSSQPQKSCSGCGFFSAADAGCGTCKILNGGAVNAGGYCTSWSARS